MSFARSLVAEPETCSESNGSAQGDQQLKAEVEYRTRLQEICNKIYAAANLDEILIDLKDEITGLFDVERMTVFVVDGKKRELVSRFKSGLEIAEIRIPVATSSLAGWAGATTRVAR